MIALIQIDLEDTAELEISWDKLEPLYDQAVQETKALLQNKNHDYDEAWRDMRISSITDIILMKLFRVKQIEDNEGGFSVEITSSNQSEIRFTRIDNNREYVITPSLIKSRIQHLVNCGGRMDKKSFHNWTPLAVTIVHLHPKLSLDGSDVVISLD